MSTESEATGGGFWRGFFTGVFLLFVGTIALIVLFPMSETMNEPMTAEPNEASSSGSGDAGGSETSDDGAAIAPADTDIDVASTTAPQSEPEATVSVEAPRVPDDTAEAPVAPSVAAADNTPVIAAQDPAPAETEPATVNSAVGAGVDVSTGEPPAAISVVEAPLAPLENTAENSPSIAGVHDQTPTDPAPAPVIGDIATVAQGPSVGTGGAVPSAPAADINTESNISNVSDSEPASDQPVTRIATQSDSGSDNAIGVSAGNDIGTAAKTFVGGPSQGAQPTPAEATTAVIPSTDEEVKTAMAPVTEVPDTGDDAAEVDTSTADKPRQRPEPPVIDGPAFESFAAEFIDKKDRPLLAIILQDVGADGLSRDSLLSIDLPVTYAIAIDDPDAPWSEAIYRENGFEVLAMVPDGGAAAITRGQARDKLTTQLPEYFAAVPGAIGILDRVDGEIQRDNNLVKELIAGLKPTGHALLVNKGSGFGSAVDLAKLEDVPSGSIARVIDPDRSPETIRSNLDRAALLASKTGSAVVIGRTYPETVTTLVRWLLGGTARSVTVAPVSAAIRR